MLPFPLFLLHKFRSTAHITLNFKLKVFTCVLNSAITCDSLGSFANGVITYRADRTSPFDLGTTATYSCNKGYYLEGEDVRTCVEDGSGVNGIWSGSTPRCAGRYIYREIG